MYQLDIYEIKNDIIVDNIFAFTVAHEITINDEDPEPQSIKKC